MILVWTRNKHGVQASVVREMTVVLTVTRALRGDEFKLYQSMLVHRLHR